ncbi:MAG: hypothetical protein JSV33_12320 [bacterium]|nr:MAG: hypothetical protein JSV33_12320 [bacterium]
MKRFLLNTALVSLVALACGRTPGSDTGIVITEASGITRHGNKLIIVGDDADGRYFEIEIDDWSSCLIPIDPLKVNEIPLEHGDFAMDLEAIDILSDGRVAVLSEQLHCLIAAENPGSTRHMVVAEYERILNEFGHRGLEGLAVTDGEDGASRIAVLWEGGYPIFENVPPQIRDRVGRIPLKPIVVVHTIPRGSSVGAVSTGAHLITLDVPEPEGEVPYVQRFRATDLVWFFQKEDGRLREEFIVLLNSENSPPDGEGISKTYERKILQRFDLEGNPVGKPLDLTNTTKRLLYGVSEEDRTRMGGKMAAHLDRIISILEESSWEQINWEGLGWFEEGVRLVAIYDGYPMDPPFAFVIDIPAEWRRIRSNSGR